MPNKKHAVEVSGERAGLGGRFGHNRFISQKPQSVKDTIKRLWTYFGYERKFLIIIFLLVIITSTIAIVVPFVIGKIVDYISNNNDYSTYYLFIILALGFAYIISSIVMFFQQFLMASVSQRIIYHLRKSLFSKFKNLSVAYFDQKSHGEIMSRFANDIDNISITISSSTIQLMTLVLTLSGSLIFMLVLSPILTIVSLLTIPLVYLLTRFVSKRTRIMYAKRQKVLGELNGYIEENISGVEIIRAFNQEEKSIDDFGRLNDELREVGTKANINSGFLMPLMNVINNLGFTMVVTTGGILALNGMVSVGIIASFLTYSKQFGRPLINLATIYNTLQTAVAGAERVFDMMDEKEEDKDKEISISLENPHGEIEFKNVSFSYREDVQIINNISFKVKSGSRIALVGPTGAGKTTIVNLLARYYDVTKGKILIDGIDIRNIKRNSLRNSFGIVLQDTYLFSGTIKENIAYGNFTATMDEIRLAARKACADVFIERLPKGYETYITESGGSLSEGQKQLIAIARTFLADKPILILDEATSRVDTRTESQIQEAMQSLMKGRTSFVIAHRLSTIRDCDEIFVVDDGKIVERGNHQELINLKGIYYKMHNSQN